jgi:hypothetical protein
MTDGAIRFIPDAFFVMPDSVYRESIFSLISRREPPTLTKGGQGGFSASTCRHARQFLSGIHPLSFVIPAVEACPCKVFGRGQVSPSPRSCPLVKIPP